MTNSTFRTGLLALLLVAGSFASASGQQRDTWKLLNTFDKSIGCGYFFDKDHGLIGSGTRLALGYPFLGYPVSIYYTKDGGATWAESTVPNHQLGAVTAISMQDSLLGYASIFSVIDYFKDSTFGRSSLWQTTDGGSTWFDTLHLDHLASCVYAQPGLLMYTKWDANYTSSNPPPPLDKYGGAYSYDGGTTWTPNFTTGNGIDFADSLHGVVTGLNGGGQGFWYTSDAGRTWDESTDQYEAWSVYAYKGTNLFFCANESQPSFGYPYRNIYWSRDAGATWQLRATFPGIHFTGTIAGANGTLYFQTDTTQWSDAAQYQHGIYRSDDLGGAWRYVGGPTNSRDTRFVVTGCQGEVVYAFDGYGNVWKTVDGGDGTLAGDFILNTDSVHWAPSPCGDTLAFTAMSTNCVPLSIDSIRQIRGTELVTVSDTSLPHLLAQYDSTVVKLAFNGTRYGDSISIVRVYAHAGEDPISHDVIVSLQTVQPTNMLLTKTASVLNAVGCSSIADTIGLQNFGCPGLVLDSVHIPTGELSVLNAFPDSISNDSLFPLRFEFIPDSAGTHQYTAEVFAHNGRRDYDTLISISATSVMVPLVFQLDSTHYQFETKYCQTQSVSLHMNSISCDSVLIDSIHNSNSSFVLSNVPKGLSPHVQDSILLSFAPDSLGSTTGTIHVFAHNHQRAIDTVITVSANNFALPQSVTMSRTGFILATKACRPLRDTLEISNQGCDSLYLDSLVYPVGEVGLNYDATRMVIGSNDTSHIAVQFTPNDGIARSLTVHAFMHTSKRIIDTILVINTTNTIPANPLQVTSDSLFLWTKYCQPTTTPLTIANFGCPDMKIDSAVIVDDARHEFVLDPVKPVVLSQDSITFNIQFWPDTAGSRSVHLKLFTFAGSEIDTVLAVAGKNLVAPEPFIPPLPAMSAGKILRIPIMLRSTLDTFTIQSFAAHVRFNTDLLTPFALDFTGTCAKNVKSSSFAFEPGNGVSIRILLNDTISDTSQLYLPLVYILDSVRVAIDTTTMVVLDTFVTDREPALALCSIPEQPFTLALLCADPLYLQLLRTGTIAFDFVGVSPNPASEEKLWSVEYVIHQADIPLALEMYNDRGLRVMSQNVGDVSVGRHSVSIAVPNESGDYMIVMSGGGMRVVKKVTLKR